MRWRFFLRLFLRFPNCGFLKTANPGFSPMRFSGNPSLDVFPAYNHVREAKAQCLPEEIVITETVGSVGVPALLKHTTARVLQSIPEPEFSTMDRKLTMIGKWGCDGSSGHSEYKQRFAQTEASGAKLFLTSFVPLGLQRSDADSSRLTYWRNPKPSSTRFCRPIKFEFVKESSSVILAEVARVREEIANLRETEISVRGKS